MFRNIYLTFFQVGKQQVKFRSDGRRACLLAVSAWVVSEK